MSESEKANVSDQMNAATEAANKTIDTLCKAYTMVAEVAAQRLALGLSVVELRQKAAAVEAVLHTVVSLRRSYLTAAADLEDDPVMQLFNLQQAEHFGTEAVRLLGTTGVPEKTARLVLHKMDDLVGVETEEAEVTEDGQVPVRAHTRKKAGRA